MRALLLRFRSELRSGWRAPVVLGLVAGLAGAAVLVAIAGARRTATAYERMLAATDAVDFTARLAGSSGSELEPDDLAALPSVAAVGEVGRYYLTTPGPRDTVGSRTPVLASSSDGTSFQRIGRPLVVEGRMPDPDAPNEILVSRILADQGSFDVGDPAPLVLVVPDTTQPDGLRIERVDQKVVGVGVTPDQIGVDEQRQGGLQMLVTPAFVREHPDFAVESSLQVKLRDGADPDAFVRAARRVGDGQAVDVASTANDTARVDRATRPQVIALYAFAAVLAIAAILIIGQAVGRQLFLASADDRTLSAIGLSRTQRFGLGILRAAPTAIVAGVVAGLVAVAASPVMPIGVARTAEPDRGVSFDALVVLAGALGVVVVLLVVAAWPAWRLARRPFTEELPEETRVTPRLAERLARIGAPPTAVAGTRFALEPGHGSTTVPTRSVLIGVAAAGTALVTAVVIAANLRHVVDTPTQWGATWDVTARVAADERELENLVDIETDIEGLLAAKQAFVEQELEKSRVVDTWSVAASNVVDLEGRAVPSLGVDRSGGVDVRIVEGRLPRSPNEVALGSDTMDALGVVIGETARARGPDLLVVGESVLPRFQTLGGADEAALNRGAVLTLEGVASRSPDFHSRSYLIRLRPGITPEEGTRALRAVIPETFAFNIESVEAPEDIEALARVTDTPIVLAAVLGVLALATLAHALVSSVRRRRRDLAILVALGFTRRQLRAQVSTTVAWQATVVTLVALVIALPLGIAFGRLLSDVFEEGIGTIPEIVVPALVLLLLVPISLVAANLIAFVPGRLAARTHPAAALRSE
jgi:hypothetical protein